jgi:hypothetical protein
LDADALARPFVEAGEAAVLIFGVDDIRVFGVNLRTKAVAALRDEPIGVRDAGGAARARGAAETEVVLRAAVDVIEGQGVVGRDIIELRDRQILFEVPGGRAVVRFVEAAVRADEIMTGVVGSIQR